MGSKEKTWTTITTKTLLLLNLYTFYTNKGLQQRVTDVKPVNNQ